jgi:hypothetical protein
LLTTKELIKSQELFIFYFSSALNYSWV